VDRREIGRRISQLKKELEAVRAHRSRYREQRHKAGIPVIALVGYTNAGKSTLLNQMAGADVYAANQLFATLDPTTRRVSLPGGRNILLSDTVGFIQKLPTTLIAAFRATLEEIAEAALILHVADASHQNLRQQVEVVEDTLAELDLPILPRILVLNKIDLLSSDDRSLENPVGSEDYEAVVPVSAATGQGLDRLLDTIEVALSSNKERFKILIPYEHGDITAFVYENCTVLDEEHTGSGVILEVQTTREIAARLFSIKAVSDVTTGDTLGRGI
jgi:GTP-binding protein HflX